MIENIGGLGLERSNWGLFSESVVGIEGKFVMT